MKRYSILVISYVIATLIFVLVILRPYAFQLTTNLPNAIDPVFYAWNLSYNATTTFKSIRNKLNTNIFYPDTNTLSLSDTMWSQSIFATPIIWITHNPILAENLSIFLTFPLAALSMFFLAYWLTQNKTASLISGFIYAFSYPRLSQIGHLPALSNQYLPLIILFILQYFSRREIKYLLASYIILILSLHSSVYLGIVISPAILIIFSIELIYLIKNKKITFKFDSIWKYFLLTTILAIGLLIVMYPYILLKIENPYIKRTLFETRELQAYIKDYISVLPSSLLSYIKFPINTGEHALYLTFVGFSVFVGSLFINWREKRKNILIFWLIGIISFIISLGAEQELPFTHRSLRLPYYYLYTYIPIFQIIRVPARFSIMIILSISALSAYIIDFLKKFSSYKIIYLAIVILYTIEIWQTYTPSVKIPLPDSQPEVYQWLKDQRADTVIIELPLRRFYTGSPMKNQLMLQYHDVTYMDNYAAEAYRTYFSAFHQKRMINGYSGFMFTKYNQICEEMEKFPTSKGIAILKDLQIKYIVVHAKQYGTLWNSIKNNLDNTKSLEELYQFNADYIYSIK